VVDDGQHLPDAEAEEFDPPVGIAARLGRTPSGEQLLALRSASTLWQSILYDRLRWGELHSEQAIFTRI
jgi:hypothetical protein